MDLKRNAQFKKALITLEEALKQKQNDFVRDSVIQRFEYTVELFWKLLKEYLNMEGLSPNSPMNVIRESRNIGLLNDDEVELALDMILDRNRSSHAYHEEIANQIAKKAKDYAKFMSDIEKRLNK